MDTPIPRRERKKAQTRKQLLRVALDLIGERGIHGTRVEDITDRSDVGKGAFYNYFASKNALVAALVAEGVGQLYGDHLERLDREGSEDVAEIVLAIIRGHEAFFTAKPVFVALFHEARGIAKVEGAGGDIGRVFGDYLRRIGAILARRSGRRGMTEREQMELAAVILGSIAGHRSFAMAAGLELHSDALARVLVSGLPSELAPAGRRPSSR